MTIETAVETISEETAKTIGLDAYTVWRSPFEMIKTQWGVIAYADWCQREAERIGKGCLVVRRVAYGVDCVAVFGPKRRSLEAKL